MRSLSNIYYIEVAVEIANGKGKSVRVLQMPSRANTLSQLLLNDVSMEFIRKAVGKDKFKVINVNELKILGTYDPIQQKHS